MTKFDYDVLVIGSGPSGESAALNAAKHNKRAAVIEDQPMVGGGCTHKGATGSLAALIALAAIAVGGWIMGGPVRLGRLSHLAA